MHPLMLAAAPAFATEPCQAIGDRLVEIQRLVDADQYASAAPVVEAAVADLTCQRVVVMSEQLSSLYLGGALVAERGGLGSSVRDARVAEAARLGGALDCDTDRWSSDVCDAFERARSVSSPTGEIVVHVDAWVDGVWVPHASAATRPVGQHLVQFYDLDGVLRTSWGEVRTDAALQVGEPPARDQKGSGVAVRASLVGVGGLAVAGGLSAMALAAFPAQSAGRADVRDNADLESSKIQQANVRTALGATLVGLGTVVVGVGASF